MMTSGSALSPLGFTRDYQHYRARAAAIPYRDTRLLLAAHFWSEHSAALGDPAYETFWREDLPPLLEAAGAPDFHDLLPDELEALAQFIERLPTLGLTSGIAPPSLWELAAKKWLYVGEVERALQALSHTVLGAGVDADPITFASDDPCEPHDLPERLLDRHGDRLGPSLVEWLKGVDSEWRAYLDGGSPNRATCVVVEQDHAGRPLRGRLRVLEGQLEKLNNGNGGHQVVFAHQLRSPDDPQIAGAYAALAALANAESGIRKTEWKGPVGKATPVSWRAGYAFIDTGRELHGGASLAFACFATGFGDLWSKDLHRARKLISHAVAPTGALAPDGRSAPISAESLACKVERVFYSPLASLVVPKSNRDAAEAAVTALSQRHARRRLRIIAIDRAADLAADGNIMIPERVCPAEFAFRAAAKYGRSVKVQVPALAVLAYLLLCLVYPKAWVGFDRNPSDVRFVTDGIRVANAKGQSLWTQSLGCSVVDSGSLWFLGNLDQEPHNELAVLLNTPRSSPCSSSASLFLFDHDGRNISHENAAILGEYPGDTSLRMPYSAHLLSLIDFGNEKRIVTVVTESHPARGHIKFWSASGDLTGWYICAGFPSNLESERVNLNESNKVCLVGYNNRMGGAAAFFVLPVDSVMGCSPPYTDSLYDLTWVKRGSQSAYVVFPRSDLSLALRLPYSTPTEMRAEPDGSITVCIEEAQRNLRTQLWYTLDSTFRVTRLVPDDFF